MSDSNIVDVRFEANEISAKTGSRTVGFYPVRYQDLALTVYNNFDLEKLSVELTWNQPHLIGRPTDSQPPEEVPACTFSDKEVVITMLSLRIQFATLRAKVEKLCSDSKGYGDEYGVVVFFEKSRENNGRVRAVRRKL